MDIAAYRKDFVIFVVDDEESIREILNEALTTAGYQCETFPTAEDGLARLTVSPPHLIFSDIRMPGMNGIQFLEQVKKLSADIEFIIMTSHASLETAVNAIKHGAYDYIFKPFDSLQDVVTTADRTIERVYMKLENEQLLEELASKNQQLANVNQKISIENQEIQLINAHMQRLSQSLDPEQVVQILLDGITNVTQGKPALFLKFIKTHSSLITSHASKIPIEQLKNLGINLVKYDAAKLSDMILSPEKIPELSELMNEVFKVPHFYALPFIYQNQPFGVVVVFDKLQDDSAHKVIESFVQITRVSFDNAMMTKKIHEMAIKDPLTGIYNRRYFNEKLEEEITRSRRTHFPLSLIYLDIDNFKKYNDQNGHPEGDVLIKAFANILQKTSRKTDVVARLGGEEFAILCPHTSGANAAVKAEKVRQTILATRFLHGEKQPMGFVSASFGVSEFPTLVSDSTALVRLADDALYIVKTGGRNKVCLAAAPKDFTPEFLPLPVPGFGTPPDHAPLNAAAEAEVAKSAQAALDYAQNSDDKP
jgi:diguanylate cyclase (GGDEF)-like protein